MIMQGKVTKMGKEVKFSGQLLIEILLEVGLESENSCWLV